MDAFGGRQMDALNKKIPEWMEELCQRIKFGSMKLLPGAPQLTIKINPDMRTKAGKCWYWKGLIEINGNIPLEDARETLAHEFAHYLSTWVDGHSGHGPAFKHWMVRLGYKPSRCHNIRSLIALGRGEWYHCSKCFSEFKSGRNLVGRRHRRCRGLVAAGAVTPEMRFGKELAKRQVAEPRPENPEAAESEGWVLALRALRESGQGSSPEARRLRRILRKAGHRGGSR